MSKEEKQKELSTLLKEERKQSREDEIEAAVDARKREVEIAEKAVVEARQDMRAADEECQSLRLQLENEKKQTEEGGKLLKDMERKFEDNMTDIRFDVEEKNQKIETLERHIRSEYHINEELRKKLQTAEDKVTKNEQQYTILINSLTAKLSDSEQARKHTELELDRMDTNNQKDSLLQKLFKEQVTHKEMDLELHKAKLQQLQSDFDSVSGKLLITTKDTSALRQAIQDQSKEHNEAIALISQQLETTTKQIGTEKQITKASLEEVDNLKERYLEIMCEGRRKEKEFHRTEITLKVELEKCKSEGAEQQLQFETDFAHLQNELEGCNKKIERLGELNLEEKQKQGAVFEELQKVTTQYDELRIKHAQVEGQVKASHVDTTQKITSLIEDVSRLEEELTESQTSFSDLTEAAEKRENSLQIKLDIAADTIKTLQQDADTKDRKVQDDALVSWHNKEQFKQEAIGTAKELTDIKAALESYKLKSETEIALLRKKEYNNEIHHRCIQNSNNSKMQQLEEDLTALSRKHDNVETEKTEAQSKLQLVQETSTQTIKSLTAEVLGYKESVAKLEAEVLCNYDKKVLAAQNEELKSTLQTYRNQITSLNHKIASLKVESDIIESQKTKALQESNSQCVRRIIELEELIENDQNLLHDITTAADLTSVSEDLKKNYLLFEKRYLSTSNNYITSG